MVMKDMISLKKLGYLILYIVSGGVFLDIMTNPALAQGQGGGQGFVTVVDNIIWSLRDTPGLVSAIAYLFGLLMASLGILDIMKHVENAAQNPLRNGLIKFVAGGMAFALPTITAVVANTIDNGFIGAQHSDVSQLGNDVGLMQNAELNGTINEVFLNIGQSVSTMPAMVSTISYLLAVILTFTGIVKLRDYVENQGKEAPMRSVIISFLAAGSFFALPTILGAMFESFTDGLTPGAIVGGDPMSAGEAPDKSCADGGDGGLGEAICALTRGTSAAPALLAAASYIFGVTLGAWGIFRIKEHVNNPAQTPIWDGVAKFAAGGAFLSLPFIIYTVRSSILRDDQLDGTKTGTFNNEGGGSCSGGEDLGGLDSVLYCFMDDIFGPMNVIVNVFAIIAGIILVMIGISRLLKGAQDGAKGPGGIGTIMTFITGGMLLSASPFLKLISTSLFGNPVAATFATLAYTEGMTEDETQHAHIVISAVLQFLVVIGLISVVRGIFIFRGVAEGNQQSSMMAGVTHMVGGALAVNLGPLLKAVQQTLGIEGTYGIIFT
ncbi:hypothetical protein N9Z27_00775 [Alphaproteobacteria bacterium]|nr:hypothetical protein [Alphaproteobacteria bacterium]